ncbi:IS3 family transposase [Lipingzhangella sp. LS1_29]|uniref:IS3 family transposase n=1 Tax=Lipingzhangella rawalii TaxID=2055835 RepID=A0ABU2H9Y0_9ACTN|nr:IS3 family transposase [Lipingzhangella rawalii]MDS1271817.1 IS3 family transposase [Lipingzhangella rawalii]
MESNNEWPTPTQPNASKSCCATDHPLAVGAPDGRTGSCFDNAVTESFFASLETELIDRTRFATRADAEREVFSYIEGFYNPHRRHSANGQLSPAEYERRHTQQPREDPTHLADAA